MSSRAVKFTRKLEKPAKAPKYWRRCRHFDGKRANAAAATMPAHANIYHKPIDRDHAHHKWNKYSLRRTCGKYHTRQSVFISLSICYAWLITWHGSRCRYREYGAILYWRIRRCRIYDVRKLAVSVEADDDEFISCQWASTCPAIICLMGERNRSFSGTLFTRSKPSAAAIWRLLLSRGDEWQR